MDSDLLEKWILQFLAEHKGNPRLVTQILHGVRMDSLGADYIQVGKALRTLKVKGLIKVHKMYLGQHSKRWRPCYELEEVFLNEY
jgi:hypothetical protein